jgi:hypothetical protein
MSSPTKLGVTTRFQCNRFRTTYKGGARIRNRYRGGYKANADCDTVDHVLRTFDCEACFLRLEFERDVLFWSHRSCIKATSWWSAVLASPMLRPLHMGCVPSSMAAYQAQDNGDGAAVSIEQRELLGSTIDQYKSGITWMKQIIRHCIDKGWLECILS